MSVCNSSTATQYITSARTTTLNYVEEPMQVGIHGHRVMMVLVLGTFAPARQTLDVLSKQKLCRFIVSKKNSLESKMVGIMQRSEKGTSQPISPLLGLMQPLSRFCRKLPATKEATDQNPYPTTFLLLLPQLTISHTLTTSNLYQKELLHYNLSQTRYVAIHLNALHSLIHGCLSIHMDQIYIQIDNLVPLLLWIINHCCRSS